MCHELGHKTTFKYHERFDGWSSPVSSTNAGWVEEAAVLPITLAVLFSVVVMLKCSNYSKFCSDLDCLKTVQPRQAITGVSSKVQHHFSIARLTGNIWGVHPVCIQLSQNLLKNSEIIGMLPCRRLFCPINEGGFLNIKYQALEDLLCVCICESIISV